MSKKTTQIYKRLVIGCVAVFFCMVAIVGGIALSINASGSPEGETSFQKTFSFTGTAEPITLLPGTYTMEAWGANGGGTSAGSGGYARGTFVLTISTTLYVVVGGVGDNGSDGRAGGFNGGGAGGSYYNNSSVNGSHGAGGGGATHISKAVGFLSEAAVRENILLVAAGGGGKGGGGTISSSSNAGGNGGGVSGATGGGGKGGSYDSKLGGGGGSSSSGGTAGTGSADGAAGTGGRGGAGGSVSANNANGGGGGGGGGWYGGGGGGAGQGGIYTSGGGGGSGYISAVCSDGALFKSDDEGFERIPTLKNDGGFARITGSPESETTSPTTIHYFSFTGEVESITLQAGTYSLEAWGANGYGANVDARTGGVGGYARTTLEIMNPTTLYVVVGSAGKSGSKPSGGAGGFNGGGAGGTCSGTNGSPGNGGGGATHISKAVGYLTESTVRNNALLVAGGGGGSSSNGALGGGGGGTNGANGVNGYAGTGGSGGSSSAGGAAGSVLDLGGTNGTSGNGGRGGNTSASNANGGGGGGGGGWFGGGGGAAGTGGIYPGGGGGGSGYIGAACSGGALYLPTEAGYERTLTLSSDGFARISSIQPPEKPAVSIPTSSNGTEFSYNAETQGPVLSSSSAYTITGATSAINAGEYTATATLNDSETKWSDGTTDPIDIDWSISKARLTIRAENKEKQFGESDSPLTWSITGFKGNDNESVITGSFNISTTAMQSSPVGTYPIIISGDVEADNYDFEFIDGTLTILEASPVYHNVIFNANGGALGEGTTNQSILDGSWASAPVNDPTQTGYIFVGWFDSQQGGELYDFETEVTSELTLWAQWDVKHYIVVYDFNGGSHPVIRGLATFGELLDLVVPMRDLYIFDGWFSMDGETRYTNSTGSSTEVWDEDFESGEISMLAKWIKVGFIISFATNTTEDNISPEVVYSHTNMTNVIKRNPVRKGYIFDGWFKESDIKTKFDFSIESPPTEDITLYAGWTAKEYTVIYNSNGGTYEKETATVIWGEKYSLAVPKLDNYYFQGWFGVDGRQFTNTAGKSDTLVWDVDVNNFNLYARWETAKYDMRFDFNDGRPWIVITHPYNEKIPASMIPDEPERDFGIFLGWFTQEGIEFDFEERGMPANGVSLTARWAVNITKLQILVSELQGYIDFDGFDSASYKVFLDALSDATVVVNTAATQTIERVKQAYDDLLTSAIELTIADFTGKVTPPNEFRPSNAGDTWVFILLGCIILLIVIGLVAWFIMMKSREREEVNAVK